MSAAPVTRSRADLDLLMRRLGTDLALAFRGPAGWWEEGDLGTTRGLGRSDLAIVADLDAADQLLITRLKTRKGELAPLGHPDYGSRHHELLGEPNTERTRNLIKLHVLECLGQEPRVAKVLDLAVTSDDRHRDTVRIVLSVRLIDRDEPRNLVIPFPLAAGTVL